MSPVFKRLCTSQNLTKSFSRLRGIRQQASFRHSTSFAMNIARVTAWGKPPQYITGPSLPDPSPSQLQLKVLAVGVPRVVRGRALGKHSSAKGSELPFDPSVDGVGLDEATGNKYYVAPGAAPLFAERANVERSHIVQLAPEADPVTVAALVNPVSSSWMALRARAIGGCQGRTVFILGATTESGRHAIHIARELGASKVVGASRNSETLNQVEGLDECVLLTDPLDIPKAVGSVDIVLDFVGGPVAATLMRIVEIHGGLQYISIGSVAGHENLVVPASLLNARPIRIMGSGMGSFSMLEVKREMPGLVAAVGKLKRPTNIVTAALADVETAWDSTREKERLVLIP
ncbi:NAD(P)-binding protein [Hypoxylon sp. FL1857]|nr:NAD(P)-binding protein [Hypoxylon sp. FL1857]